MNIQVKPSVTPSHVKTQSLICGTLVTTDLKRARRMYEEVFDMECVEPEKGVMYVREKGHRAGGTKHGKPYWVLEVRETPDVAVPQEMLNHWGFEAPRRSLCQGQRQQGGLRYHPRAEAILPQRLLCDLHDRQGFQLVGSRISHAGSDLHGIA
jgi:hypothetical protein